jgi:hypothetical protein
MAYTEEQRNDDIAQLAKRLGVAFTLVAHMANDPELVLTMDGTDKFRVTHGGFNVGTFKIIADEPMNAIMARLGIIPTRPNQNPHCCFMGCDHKATLEIQNPAPSGELPSDHTTQSCGSHVHELLEPGGYVEPIEPSDQGAYYIDGDLIHGPDGWVCQMMNNDHELVRQALNAAAR